VSPRGELAAVVAREGSLRLLAEHARLAKCRFAVFGMDGAPLRAEAGVLFSAEGGASGGDAAGASSPVTAFDRVVGWVVAKDDAPGGAAARVAADGAALLGELCAREYELNDLSREILGSYEELNLFSDLAGELAGAGDADAVCRVVLAEACRVIAAEDAWILLADGPNGALRVAASRDPSEVGRVQPARAGRAGAAFATRVTEPVDDVRLLGEGALVGLETAAYRTLMSVALCVPGRAERPALGVLQLRDKRGGAVFTAADLKLAQALAAQAGVLIQNSRLIALERELAIARTIQQSLLPGEPPRMAGLDVAGTCLPASNVGGDYFDFLPAGPGSLSFLVADVSGHNLAAALLQTAARAAFRSAVLADPAPDSVLRRASRALHDDLSRSEHFLTAWLGCVDAATGRLAYSDAGHNPALHYRAATRDVRRLASGGIPIGVDGDAEFDAGSVVLESGDVVVAYTDGITEASPGAMGEQYGEERLAALLDRLAGRPASEVVEAVLADVARHCGERPAGDDRSLVVLRRP
jgi:sigma-B regulation protein RsbU (phosphoserine phosphatase)